MVWTPSGLVFLVECRCRWTVTHSPVSSSRIWRVKVTRWYPLLGLVLHRLCARREVGCSPATPQESRFASHAKGPEVPDQPGKECAAACPPSRATTTTTAPLTARRRPRPLNMSHLFARPVRNGLQISGHKKLLRRPEG